MAPKASAHIEKGKPSYVYHNHREYSTVNSIFPTNENKVSLGGKDALALYKSELKKRIISYVERTGQKIQKNAITHFSAIVNLNSHHRLADLEPLKIYLEKTLDTIVFQIAVHQDEGHIDEQGNKIINYHAHLEMLGIDSEGYSIRKKLTRNYLCMLQTMNAKFLNMDRGSKHSKRKRLGTYAYKEAMKIVNAERKKFLDIQTTLENDLQISQTSVNTFKDKSDKADKTIAKNMKNLKKFAVFIRKTSKLFNLKVTNFDEMEELFGMIKKSRQPSEIVSILPNMVNDIGGTNHKI